MDCLIWELIYTLQNACPRPFKRAEETYPRNHVGESDEATICWKWQLLIKDDVTLTYWLKKQLRCSLFICQKAYKTLPIKT